jgi:hypothetical protein
MHRLVIFLLPFIEQTYMIESIYVSLVQTQGYQIVLLFLNSISKFLMTKGSIVVSFKVFYFIEIVLGLS